jgi:hypothetical protein
MCEADRCPAPDNWADAFTIPAGNTAVALPGASPAMPH